MKIKLLNKILDEGKIVFKINEIVDYLNLMMNKMTIDDNFNGVVKTLVIPNGEEVEVSHSLKMVPKYWLTLRHVGNGLITEGDTPWTDKVIYLKNNGASDVTIIILIMRG